MDYRVTVKVRNARLLRAIEERGYRMGGKFAEAAGVNYTWLAALVRMKESPLDPEGTWKPPVIALCSFLKCSPYDLFSEDQMQKWEKTASERDVDRAQCLAIAESYTEDRSIVDRDPLETVLAIEGEPHLNQAMGESLTGRDARIVKDHFGFEGEEPMTLVDIAIKYDVSTERVRQIINESLRRLRWGNSTINTAYQDRKAAFLDRNDEYRRAREIFN